MSRIVPTMDDDEFIAVSRMMCSIFEWRPGLKRAEAFLIALRRVRN